VVFSMKRPRNIQRHVEDRVSQKKCLIAGCDKDTYALGLCKFHHNQFVYQRRKRKTEADRAKYHALAARRGLVLMSHECRQYAGSNVFAAIG